MKILLFLLAILVGGYLLICLLVYTLQEKLLFPAEIISQDSQYTFPFKQTGEEVWLEGDNAKINGLWFKTSNAKGVILYLHGNAGSLKDWGYVAPTFLERGYDILIVDYRGYGKSTGHMSEKGLLDDGLLGYNFLKERYDESRIIIYGRSLGSGIAAYVASRNKPDKVFLETPYYSMRVRASEQFPWLPAGILLKYPLNTFQYLLQVKAPIFLIHGTGDQVISVSHSRRLENELSPKPVYVEVKGGTHNNLDAYPEYHDFLNQFLTQ